MYVKVGRVDFAVEHLHDKTLTECLKFFSHIDEEVVTIAWRKVNKKLVKKQNTDSSK